MPSFDDSSPSASSVSDKMIEVPEAKATPGKNGLPIRVMSSFWQCVPEHWLRDKDDNVRRFRCANVKGEECPVCDAVGQAGDDSMSRRVYYYTPAVSGTAVKVPSKKKPGKKITKIQFEDICKILKYGITVWKKFKAIHQNPEYRGEEDNDITARNLMYQKDNKGQNKVKYDVVPSPKVTALPEVEGIEDVIKEIEALSKEPVDMALVRKMLGIKKGKAVEEAEEEGEEVDEAEDEAGEEVDLDDSDDEESDDESDSDDDESDDEADDEAEGDDEDESGDDSAEEEDDDEELDLDEDDDDEPEEKPEKKKSSAKDKAARAKAKSAAKSKKSKKKK